MEPSESHPYLDVYARLKHAEHESLLLQRRLTQLRRELAALPQPTLKVRVYHLASADAAFESVGLSSRWHGSFATEHGAVLVLGTDDSR